MTKCLPILNLHFPSLDAPTGKRAEHLETHISIHNFARQECSKQGKMDNAERSVMLVAMQKCQTVNPTTYVVLVSSLDVSKKIVHI